MVREKKTNLQVGHVDVVLSPGHQGGELLAAEHPQPVQADDISQPVPEINVLVTLSSQFNSSEILT